MKYDVQAQQGSQKQPTTQVFKLLDDQLLIFLRAWGSQDYNQRFVDEVTHYLSTAQADLEITSPFEFTDNLSNLANKVRIAMLLAHDYFYKGENKSVYSVGFEAALIMSNKNELAWAALGRFDIGLLENENVHLISSEGADADKSILLPIQLLGVDRDLQLRCGSLKKCSAEIVVSSLYNQPYQWTVKQAHNLELQLGTNDATYWFSKIKSE